MNKTVFDAMNEITEATEKADDLRFLMSDLSEKGGEVETTLREAVSVICDVGIELLDIIENRLSKAEQLLKNID